MSFSRRTGLRRPFTILVASAALGALALTTAGSAAAAPATGKPNEAGIYLVQMKGSPLATYTGGVAGIPGTKPAPGKKLNKRAWEYESYRQHLRNQQAKVKQAAGVDQRKTVAEYDAVFNGFAAKLTPRELANLRKSDEVAAVYKNRVHTVQTVSTPAFLGLEGAAGTWKKQFGDPTRAGEGVIIGVLDTGYWPESPSFAPLPEPRPDQAIIDQKWGTGEQAAAKCDPGLEQPAPCNNKVIGARWYNKVGLGDKLPDEFHSPRDFNGHGSHTAGTSGGNHDVTATVNGNVIGKISGMAPAARLAIYKVLWQQPGGSGSGTSVDIVAAINDAITDGVDILNYSIGDNNDAVGPEDVAFLQAAAAGVFIAASAGNSGPGPSTVDNAAPWQTTVAASTHDRGFVKTATLGDGRIFDGAGHGVALPSAPLIDAAAAPAANVPPSDAELCGLGSLDATKVTGKIVLCKRGIVARVEKSQTVKDAGGVGMIQYNPAANSLNADFHAVPSIHVDQVAGAAIKAYAATAGATAALSEGRRIKPRSPVMADFSSVGPSKSSRGDLLKPDITAPGVDVLAPVAPGAHGGNTFDLSSGTSMSSPHIAGIAAMVKSKNQGWSPMAIKSALMTTAGQLDNEKKPIQAPTPAGVVNATPLNLGSGHVNPGAAFDPGLVYESSPEDWLKYTCGIGVDLKVGPHPGEELCPIIGSIDPSDLNYPSIAVGDLAGKQTITRTVTNVTDRSSIYVAKVEPPAGYVVTVKPSTITVPPGRSVTYTVDITRTNAALQSWSFGALTWQDLRGHRVRSPIALRATEIASPPESSFTGASGSRELTVRTSYKGHLTAKAAGLVAGEVTTKRLVGFTTDFDTAAPKESAAVKKVTVTVPEGTKEARVATFGADHAAESSLELYAFDSAGELIGASGDGTAEQKVTLPAPGKYDIYIVQGFLPSDVTEQDVKLNLFLLGTAAAGNLTVTPAVQPVTVGATPKVTAAWTGLTPGKRYLGKLEYGNGSPTPLGSTLIWVVA